MKLADYENYRAFIKDSIKSLPNEGRGELKKISLAARVHSTTLSQILSAKKDLTIEQAIDYCTYMGFSSAETDYFLNLVQIERAGTVKLKNFYRVKILEYRHQCEKLSGSLHKYENLPENVKSIFYSNWYFSGIRILTSIPEIKTVSQISSCFDLPKKIVREALDFLTRHKLCSEVNGEYSIGPTHTHLDPDSIFINNHRKNWRDKAFEKFVKLESDEFAFSSPISLSREDFYKVKRTLQEVSKETLKTSITSEAEVVACLNIDWTKIGKF